MAQQTAPDLEPVAAPGGEPVEAPDRKPQPPPVGPITSALMPLDRLSTVRPDTVVVELSPDRAPLLRRPGDLLLPAWTPWGAAVQVLVVSTAAVPVRVGVEQVLTLDGQLLAVVELDLKVRLRADDVPALVAEHGVDLGTRLVLEVQRAVGAGARTALGRQRAQDVQQTGSATTLGEQWLPETLADGALVVESFSVARLDWAGADQPAVPDQEDTVPLPRMPPADPALPLDATPAGLVAAQPAEAAEPPLRLGILGREDRHQASRSADSALALVYLPAVISVTAWWIFFTAYWLPELMTVPGARFLLEQLSPIATKELTSRGEALVSGQGGRSGAPAAILLVASLMLAPLARSRYWLARLALWPITYVASVAAAVAVLGVLLRGRLLEDLLGVALLVVWVCAAGATTWHSLWVDIDTLPGRPADVAWLLGLFALVGTAPVALGRAVFAPELRAAAIGVLPNGAAMRWAALLSPATAWVYASGLLLGVLVWAAYLLWPPRRVRQVGWPVAALLVALLALTLVGPQASIAAGRQAQAMRTESPGAQLGFTCGVWTRQAGGRPVQTLVISGLGCKRVNSFRGYVQTADRRAGISLSPVRARTFDGARVDGRLVAAQYGDVVVVAATDRLDRRLTALVGLRLADASELWRVGCRADRSVRIRFAGASGGDDPASARQTRRNERASVVLDCSGDLLRVDPRTGRVS